MAKSKLIVCKSCGTEIAKSAKVCPKCGAKNKRGILLPVLGVVVALALVGAIGGDSDEPTKVGDTNTAAVSTELVQTEFGVGEVVEQSGILVTMTEVKESKGDAYNRPADGNKFVACYFEIDNQSSKDINISSIMSFEAYVDDYAVDIDLMASVAFDGSTMDATVAAGKKTKGFVAYEVPADYEKLEIRFTPSFWSGKEITFIA